MPVDCKLWPGQAKQFVTGHVLHLGFRVATEGRVLALVLLRSAYFLHQVIAYINKGDQPAVALYWRWNAAALLGGFRRGDVIKAQRPFHFSLVLVKGGRRPAIYG